MTIRTNQTITPYNKDSVIKPQHPVWKLRNEGTSTVLINGVFLLPSFTEFGIDAMELVIPVIERAMATNPQDKIEIVNDTQFTITFLDPRVGITRKVLLFETSFIFEK